MLQAAIEKIKAMKRIMFILALALAATEATTAQTYFTRNGYIGFSSKTPLEDIKAENRQVYAMIDPVKKTLGFTLLLRSFLFDKELMQEHFNENYVESEKYPKASFMGTINGDVNAAQPGRYPVQVKGQLTLHGVTRPVETPAVLEVQTGKLTGKADFKITPADYNIRIPSLVKDKIESQITIHVQVECTPSK